MAHVAAKTVEAGGCKWPVWEEHTAEQALRNIVVHSSEQDVIKEI